MRRIIAGVLLSAVLVQSSGATALAAPGSGGSVIASVGAMFASLETPLHHAWLNSSWHAMLSGQIGRYEAMHAPAPTFPHVIRITRPPYAGRWHEARLVRRYGSVARVPGLHRPEAIDPRRAPRDPMAMRRSTSPGAPASSRTATLRFAPRWNARGRFTVGNRFPPPAQPMAAGRMRPMYCGLNGCFTPPPTPTPTPSPTPTPTNTPSPTPSPTASPTATPNGLAPSTTGINHYWTYEEEPLPGIGKAMVNVGNGNLLVQVDDLDIPERGIDLAFRRTYNSQSGHDASGSDGSTPSVFGNGWTNTFDAHLAYNATYNIISVYDIDGARYDFCANGQGQWNACGSAGQNDYTILTSDGSCGYYWTKKTGTAYYFEAPNQPSTCGTQIPAGLSGRILAIQGRNVNNSLTFAYSWANGNDTNPENLTQIVVSHSDGQSVTLTFGLLNGTGPDELQSISRPDGSTISYEYDGSGDLIEVDRPGNTTTVAQTCSSTNTNCIPETYTYNAGYLIATANSPRYTVSARNNGGTAQEGDTVNFAYDGSKRITSMTDYGVVNFAPSDGTATALQPGEPTGLQSWYSETFSGYDTGTTTVSDSDGHSRMWTFDGLWRVTQTQEWTGALWLVSNETWDGNDDLTSFTDERNNTTVASYDASGNTIMEAQPSVTTSMGTFQPTSWYQYDSHNNLTYYCDPIWSHEHGGDYPNGSDPCTGSPSGVVHYSWDFSDPNEPFGRLNETTTAMGDYHNTFTYNADGMPTAVAGDSFQEQNGNTVQPKQSFVYDSYGNLVCYSNLTDGNGTHWWRLTYDGMNRQTAVADPDDASLSVAQCSNTPGLPGSRIQTTTTYFADGEVASKQTPSEYADNYSTTFTYDVDGDELSETRHFNCTSTCTPGTTTKWYDGDDRVVEVQLPHDTADVWSFDWMTRYIYDLTQGGTVSIPLAAHTGGSNGPFHAYGDLYETQEYLGSGSGYSGWTALKGNAYDALDRSVTQYQYSPLNTATAGSSHETLEHTTFAYDATPQTYGLLTSKTDGIGETTSYTYDADARITNTSYSGDGGVTPAKTLTYDPDGRTVDVQLATLGTEQYLFDADSRLTESIEPSGLPSAATLTYGYYPNGWRSSLSVSSSALTQSNLQQYNYRNDGRAAGEIATYGSTTGQITETQTPTGRPQSTVYASSTRTFTYDTYGRLSTDSADGGFSGFTYDAEGEPLGYTAPYPWSTYNGGQHYSETVTQSYTVRGELANQKFSNYSMIMGSCSASNMPPTGAYWPPGFQGIINHYANGAVGSTSYDTCADAGGVNDPLSTLNLGDFNSSWYDYDAAGRQTLANGSWSGTACVGDTCDPVTYNGSYTKSYDAENHLIKQQYSTWLDTAIGCPPDISIPAQRWDFTSESLSYVWGNNGRLAQAPSPSGSTETLHWDGTSLLFTTNASGAVDDIRFGDFGPLGVAGDITFSGGTSVVYQQRDFTGSVGTPPNPSRQLCSSTNPANVPIWQPGPDGITDGVNVFQGVRSYDPVIGTWNSPDAYQGDVGDPMSQKAYMWDGNNSFEYQDATGYKWTYVDPSLNSLIDLLLAFSPTFAMMWSRIDSAPGSFVIAERSGDDPVFKDTEDPGYIITGLFFRGGDSVSSATGKLLISSEMFSVVEALMTIAHEVSHAYNWATDPETVSGKVCTFGRTHLS